MDNVYGEACRPYLRFILRTTTGFADKLRRLEVSLTPKSNEDNKERFYRDTIVTAIVAGKIAEKLGLIAFDIAGMKKVGARPSGAHACE